MVQVRVTRSAGGCKRIRPLRPSAAHLTFRGLGTAGFGCQWWWVPQTSPQSACPRGNFGQAWICGVPAG